MQRPIAQAALLAALAAAPSVQAAELRGFYGGISLRDNGAEQGVSIGSAGNVGRFTPSLTDGRHSQTLVFGGYRWGNDLSVEASLASTDGYRLSGRGGVGLMLGEPPGATGRAWNLDVYGNWSFWQRFSLYGRLGYSQSDATPLYSTSIASSLDRPRDGLSYGVGLRYDVNRAFGLRLEYARVGNGSEASAPQLPDGDQVQFGIQYRF